MRNKRGGEKVGEKNVKKTSLRRTRKKRHWAQPPGNVTGADVHSWNGSPLRMYLRLILP